MVFQYNIKHSNGCNILIINGKLISKADAEAMISDAGERINGGKCFFIVDMKNLGYINSTGINVLINILTMARNKGGDVLVANVPERIHNLLLITKLSTVFQVTKTIDEAFDLIKTKQLNS